jgi:hypothetical protein
MLQDDTYTESYISTIGVDFVSVPEGVVRMPQQHSIWGARRVGWMLLTGVLFLFAENPHS